MKGPRALLAAALLLTAGSAHAQASYRSAPIGGRSALMGGTGVALARDGSAPFLNPATILHIDDSGVAFSVNFFASQWTTLSGFHQPGGAEASRRGAPSLPGTDLQSSRLDPLPSTLCLFLTLGNWGDNLTGSDPEPGHRKGRRKLAACLGTLERQVFSASGVYQGSSGGLSATQATSVARSWNRLYVGPTYSVYVSDRVALGASLHGVWTTSSSTWGVDTFVRPASGPSGASFYDTSMNASSIDLAAMLGLVWHLDDARVLGLSVSTPTAHLSGSYSGTAALQSQGGTFGSSTLVTSTGGFQAPAPVRVAVGIGEELRTLRVEADAGAYLPLTYLARADLQTQQVGTAGLGPGRAGTSTLQIDGQPIVDAALGVEYFLSRGVSLLGGASLDFSALRPLPATLPPGALAESRMQRVGASFGLGSYGDGNELLLGTELSYAWGRSAAFDAFAQTPGLTLVDQRSYGVMVVIAGGVSLTAVRRTIRDLGSVVKLPEVK